MRTGFKVWAVAAVIAAAGSVTPGLARDVEQFDRVTPVAPPEAQPTHLHRLPVGLLEEGLKLSSQGPCSCGDDDPNGSSSSCMGNCNSAAGASNEDKFKSAQQDCDEDPVARCGKLKQLRKEIQCRRKKRMQKEKMIEQEEQEALLRLKYGVKPNDDCGCDDGGRLKRESGGGADCDCEKAGGAGGDDQSLSGGGCDDDEVMKTERLRRELDSNDGTGCGCGGGGGGGDDGADGGCDGGCGKKSGCCDDETSGCDAESIRRRIEIENEVDKALKQRECARKAEICKMRRMEQCDQNRIKKILQMAKCQDQADKLREEELGGQSAENKALAAKMEKALSLGLKALKKKGCGSNDSS